MVHELGLVVSLVICAWIGLDVVQSMRWWRPLACVAALAGTVVLWSTGELLLSMHPSPGDILPIRRLLFLGVCGFLPAWLWTALELSRSPRGRSRRVALIACVSISAFFYSCLYWDTSGLFIEWSVLPPQRGPLFALHTVIAWGWILLGLGWLLRGAVLTTHGRPRWALVFAALTPLLANASYLLLDVPDFDPTPMALAVSAVAFRAGVIDLAWAPRDLSFIHGEVLAQMDSGLLLADRSGRIVDASAAACRMLGEPFPDTIDVALERAAAHPRRMLEARRFPLERRGRVVGAGALLVDRTAAFRTERRLELTTRLEALGTLAGGLGHEINNPLAVIRANLGQLEPLVAELDEASVRVALRPPLRERAADAGQMLADATESTLRIQELVERLAHFTDGRHDAEPVALDIEPLLARTLAMVTFGAGHDGVEVVRSEPPAPAARGVEDEVVEILFHLLMNALQLSEGRVPPCIEVEAADAGVVFRVCDRGPGIAPEALEHLFDPFYTTARPGHLGVGLARAHQLARQNQGGLEAANRAGGGAVFTLWLPAWEGAESVGPSVA